MQIRANILTESNIRDLVRLMDEEMDGVAAEQRQRLETIESELVDVKRRLGRLYDLAETTDLDIEDFKPRIRDHRERQERLEASAAESRAMLSERRDVLDDVETITAYAQDMSVFLNESELTERRAFIGSFVKEIVVMPGNAVVRYAIPMPDDSPIPGRDAEEMALAGCGKTLRSAQRPRRLDDKCQISAFTERIATRHVAYYEYRRFVRRPNHRVCSP